jgi:MFS family permease
MKEMEQAAAEEKAKTSGTGEMSKESLLHRKYVVPFVLACVILACNQLTGINSIIGYNATILIQAGLGDKEAHLGYVILTLVNFLMTMIAVMLVDRKGRKFLLSLGSAGIIVSLVGVGLIFHQTEKLRVDCKAAVQEMVDAKGQAASIKFDQDMADSLLAHSGDGGKLIAGRPATLTIIYSCGDFTTATNAVRSDDAAAKPLKIARANCVPTVSGANRVVAFFSNPLANLEEAQTAPLKIDAALLAPVPSTQNGWLTAIFIFLFVSFFAVGPGVCVWLALSELMPTRIRSNGMSIALVINQAVSTTIAAVFLPTVGKYGYSTMFFAFAAFTVIYFVTAAFFLPETKGKTLEEIEEHFSGHAKRSG